METSSPDDPDDLSAQIMAQKLLLNALLIALAENGILAGGDIAAIVESSIAGLDRYGDPFLAKVVSRLEEFREGTSPV